MKRTLRRFSANTEILNPGGRRSESSLRCVCPAAGAGPRQAIAINTMLSAARISPLESGSSPTDGGDSKQQFAVRVQANLGRREWHVEIGDGFTFARQGNVAPQDRAVRSPELERQRGESEQTPLRFLALRDTHDHSPRSGVVLPADVELGVPGLVQPLVEEPAKVRAGRLLHDVLEVSARGCRVAIGRVVGTQPAEERR